MSARYDHTVYLNVGSNEIACEIVYTVTPGSPEQGPTYDCGGQPAEDAECDIVKIEAVIEKWHGLEKRVTRVPVEGWLYALISSDPDIHAAMLDEAGSENSARADDAADQRRDWMRAAE